jgi:hypothetical protein
MNLDYIEYAKYRYEFIDFIEQNNTTSLIDSESDFVLSVEAYQYYKWKNAFEQLNYTFYGFLISEKLNIYIQKFKNYERKKKITEIWKFSETQ